MQWYIDEKETMKQYFLVRMKEACGDALSLESILSLKIVLKESWWPMGAVRLSYSTFFIDNFDVEFHPD